MPGYIIETVKEGLDIPAHTKKASERDMSSYLEVQAAMRRIYEEDPSHWPYGLNIPGHDAVYAVKEASTGKVAGFVGWQEREVDGRRVGSYSIGILPEYRGRGFAKEAVAKVIGEKVAGVDEVRAYVVKGNAASDSLAGSLGVRVNREF